MTHPDPPTLKDVAERAHVHYTTASRALRGMPDVHAETALRIRAVAQEIGYSPNPNALALRRAVPQRIAAVLTDPVSIDQLSRYSQPFWLSMLMGLVRHLAVSGIGVVQTTHDASAVLEAVPVKAVLLLSIVNDSDNIPPKLRQAPLVTERNHRLAPQAVARVGHDHAAIAREACSYLAARDARRVAYLPLSSIDNLSVAASQGYVAWCSERQQEPVVIDPRADPAEQCKEVRRAIRQGGVDSIYATTGELGPIAEAIRAEGLTCPQDVQVVCIGEGVIERLLSPPFTSISLQGAQCAADMSALLTSVVAGDPVTDLTFGHKLVKRGSTREVDSR